MPGLPPGSGTNRPRVPLAFLRDQITNNFVSFRIERIDDRLGGTERDLMLAASSSIQHGYFTLHRILFPNADKASSTPNFAVWFAVSSTGFTSTISMPTIFPLSHRISISQMGLAVGQPAANRRADARSLRRVDRIHVERQMEAGRAVDSLADRFRHYGAQTALVDLAHRECGHTGFADVRHLSPVYVTQADDRHILRIDFRSEAKNPVSSEGPRPMQQASGMP